MGPVSSQLYLPLWNENTVCQPASWVPEVPGTTERAEELQEEPGLQGRSPPCHFLLSLAPGQSWEGHHQTDFSFLGSVALGSL